MRILYLADIRFPLERANGIQSMETCHALAARGHDVRLVVRPDSHTPPRDPFAFYGLPRIAGLHIEVAPITGPAASRRVGYLTFTIGRAMGRTRQDLIFTRDLGLASLLLRLPAAVRAPVVYEAHGIAADVAAALPGLLTGAPEASPAKLRRLARRDAHVWSAAEGYVTITAGLARELTRRFGERPRIAVVADGVRAAEHAEHAGQAAEHAEHAGQAAEHAEHAEQSLIPRPEAQSPTSVTPSPMPRPPAPNPISSNLGVTPSPMPQPPAPSPISSNLGVTPSPMPRPPAPSPTPVFTIGYAGHLYPWKGVDLIIEAVAALRDTRGLIIGGHEKEPDLARVKAFAEQLHCAPRVTFTGLIPPAEVAARLRQADVLTLPNPASALSSTFTSPLKLFEYMASGRPIVASDLPSIREILTDGRNALLVEPGNPQALTAGIERIKNDAALGRRLAEQAMQDVRQFTWARRAGRLEALFADVTGTSA